MTTEKERIYLAYLVLHCQYRDSQAWQELVDLYEQRLFYFVRQLVRQEADALNVMQDVWLKVFRSIGQLNEPAALTPWLYRVARNAALVFLRRRHREAFIEDCRDAFEPMMVEEPEKSNYAADQVHRGLASLSLPHREVLTLFYLEDFTLQEIAAVLAIPVGTARSRMHYAKKALKTVLEKETEDGK